jgi:hypothetical protein
MYPIKQKLVLLNAGKPEEEWNKTMHDPEILYVVAKCDFWC